MEKADNDHERVIAAFARSSFSEAGLFHPKPWKKKGEPADLVLKVGRSVFLFYMTRTKQWFETACLHNLDQASKHMAHWRNGLPIRGKNVFRSFEIQWADVDNIAVISVVDGDEAGCCHHHPDIVGFREKLACVVTINGDVLEGLARLGGGARELVCLCSHLCAVNGKIPGEQLLEDLQRYRRQLLDLAWERRPHVTQPISPKDGRDFRSIAIRQFRAAVLSTGRSTNHLAAYDCLCELGWLEIFSLGSVVGEAAARNWEVPDGSPGPRVFYTETANMPVKFGVGAGTLPAIAKYAEVLLKDLEKNELTFQWFATLDFKAIGCLFVYSSHPPSVVTEELTTLRKSLTTIPLSIPTDMRSDQSR